ncbi:MAG TPA: phage tail length tape measure family protein, partial [Caulobacteraceae bacterium]
ASRGNFNRMASSATLLIQGLGLLSPAIIATTLGIIGLTAVVIAAEIAAIQYSEQQKKLVANLVGVGAAAGQSASQIRVASDEAMRASGQSIQSMTAASEAFAAAGVTQTRTIAELDASINVYAALTGEKAANAQKELAAAMADPARGAVELNDKLHFLDQGTLDHIRSLQAMGDKEGAVNLLMEALKKREDEARDAGVGLRTSFDNLKLGATFLWQEIGKVNNQLQLYYAYGTGSTTPQDHAAQLKAQAEAIQKAQREARLSEYSTNAGAVVADTPEQRAIAEKQALQAKDVALRLGMSGAQQRGDKSEYAKDASALQDVVRALHTYLPAAEKAHQIAVLEAQIAATKDKHLKDQLTTQKEMLRLSGQVMSPAEAQQRAQDAGAIAGARAHGSKGPKDRSQSAMALRDTETAGEEAIAAAYLQSDAAALRAAASAKTYDDALKEHANAAERARMQQSELNNELAKLAVEAAKDARGNIDQTAAEKALNDAVAAGTMSRAQAAEQLKEEAKLRPILAAYDVADAKTKATLKPVIDALTASQKALNDEQTRTKLTDLASADQDQIEILRLRLSLVNATKQQQDSAVAKATATRQVKDAGGDPTSGAGKDVVDAAVTKGQLTAQLEGAQQMRAMTQSVEQETAAFEKQRATLGMTLEQADRYNEMQKLLAEAKKDGITLDDQEVAKLQALANGYATAAQGARTLAQAQKAALTATESLASSFSGAISGMVFDGKSLTSTAHDLAKSLGKEGLEAVLTGSGPFAGLMGTANSNVVGGANGGVLSQLIGSVMKVPGASPGNVAGGLLGGKGPAGTAMDPIYTAPSAMSSLTGGGGSNPLSGLMSMFGGGKSSAGATDSLGMMADLLHEGTSYVGTPAPKVNVSSSLFVGAPRLHSGLAPDEYPAILQTGEEVVRRGGSRVGSRNTTVNMHIHGVSDTGGFQRSQRQIASRMKRAVA